MGASVKRVCRRVWQFFTEKAWLIGFGLLALSSLPHNGKAQQRPRPRHVAYTIGAWGLPMIPPLQVTEYSQPFIYTVWWGQIAQCEGFPVPDSAKQASVQFFSVPSSFFALGWSGGMLAGTLDNEPSIYMGAPYVWEEPVVKHEMLHVILHWAGYEFLNFHPPEFFERPDCGIHIYGTPHNEAIE